MEKKEENLYELFQKYSYTELKQLFKEASTVEVPKGLPFIPDDLKPKMELINRKPILPSEEELEENNRSHSAKLRVARKIHK